MAQKSLVMPEDQKRGIRQLRRLYLGRLGDVLRQRQAINAQLRSAMSTAMEGGRQMAAGYLTVRPCSACSLARSVGAYPCNAECGSARGSKPSIMVHRGTWLDSPPD